MNRCTNEESVKRTRGKNARKRRAIRESEQRGDRGSEYLNERVKLVG